MSGSTAPNTPTEEVTAEAPASENQWTPPASQADLDRIIADRLARERNKFADYADLKEKAAQFDAAEEAAKSEAQKQAEALQAAQAELAAYKQREQISAWAREVAEATGVPADALRGGSKEDLEEHAEQLKALGVGQSQPSNQPPVPTIGQEPPRPGNRTIDQQIAAAEAAGDTEIAMTLKAMKLGAVSAT